MRPLFDVDVPSASLILLSLQRQLLRGTPVCQGQVFRKHAVLQVRESARHLWSPYLNIEIREEEDAVRLHGRFSPHPNVWTAFMAIYGLLLMIGLGGLVLGLAQMSLGSAPWGWALMPAAMVMAAFVYGAVFIGQGMSAEQMYEMRSFLDTAVMECASQAPAESASSGGSEPAISQPSASAPD